MNVYCFPDGYCKYNKNLVSFGTKSLKAKLFLIPKRSVDVS